MNKEMENMNNDIREVSAEWTALHAKLNEYLSVYDKPIPSLKDVNVIPDAPICGGGKLTLALDGTHRDLNCHISKSDFWVVKLMPDDLFQKFHARPSPLCSLGVSVLNADEGGEGFQHVQDMSEAEVRSLLPLEGGMLHMRSVAVAQQDMIVVELEVEGASASLSVSLQTDNEYSNFFILQGVDDDDTIWLRKEHTSFITVNAAVALRVSGADRVRAVCSKGNESSVSFDVVPGSKVRVLVSVKGGKDEYKPLEKALASLDDSDVGKVDSLLEDHAEWWKAFWLKSWIDINDSLIERFYYGAQYVLGCSIDLDSRVIPGLAGGWITNPDPIWGGSYTMNYNGESPFWGLCSSNRGEFLLPYARVCLDYIATGRKLAKRLDTKGIVMPVMIGPWGLADNDDAVGQKSNASLAAVSLIWHYEFSRDQEYLEEILYPYVRELMDFWEDNLVLDDNGRYVIEDAAARERNQGDRNPSEDLAYVRMLSNAAVSYSEILGVDQDCRDLWRDFAERISQHPAVVVDGDYCFKEAENRMVVSSHGVGDNVCALNHVYPGGSIDNDVSGQGKIIARNTLRYLQSWNQENSFTRVFSQAVRAEWSGSEILDIFKQRISSGDGPHEIVRRNNTFLPGDHSFEGTAGTEFINSMLAHAHGGVLKVFNVWPAEKDASFERLRVKGAFLVSGSLKDANVSRVEILSEQGETCRMQSCWPGHAIAVEHIGDNLTVVEVSSDAGVYSWNTVADGLYRVVAGEALAEVSVNLPVMLVPVIDPTAATGGKSTDVALDILLTPETTTTQIECDVIYADESWHRCTVECSFGSRDHQVSEVNADGVITGAGRGRTCIDIVVEIDGVSLSCAVSVYVLQSNIISNVTATTGANLWKSWNSSMHSPYCLVSGMGTDCPDITALHRANSYGFGLFAVEVDDGKAWIQFDLGKLYDLDEMWIWNYNCPDNYRVLWWNGGTALGMREVNIETSEDGEQWEVLKSEGYPFRLAKASGKQWMPATNLDDGKNSPIRFNGIKARYLKLTPNSEIGVGNWGGEHFGLSQVRLTAV